MSQQTQYRMHWWFFVDRLVPWIFAAAVMMGVFFLFEAAVERFELPSHMKSSFQYGVVIVIVAGSVLSLAISAIQWSCTRLVIAEGELKYAKGVLNRTVARVPIPEIASVDLHQSLFQRIMGTGDLVVDMRGATLLRMKLLDDPEGIQNAVLSLRPQAEPGVI
ncbi:PH domain-containing protein [uncultured Tateyamaria sp.]|uniref:PH domain-containing protein n=1 Tax=uncultured Tateyamaria sp. TaxID=455651 RepID=UPI00261DCD72|nr:PH domain-containing protein [uncultured Tateyamaria sp.]